MPAKNSSHKLHTSANSAYNVVNTVCSKHWRNHSYSYIRL